VIASSISGGGGSSGGGGGGGTGDVAGPASSTDNAVARFDGVGGKTLQNSTLVVSDAGNVTFPGRILGKKGPDVASDANVTLGNGNYFTITGTTAIDTINSSGWTSGSLVTLRFTASLTLRHDQIGDFVGLMLASGAHLAVGANDIVVLLWDEDEGYWFQVSYQNL
jgi:hypothetical protein